MLRDARFHLVARTLRIGCLLIATVAAVTTPSAAAAAGAGANAADATAVVAVRRKIGLVLSGGGARGAAHIGVLKLLDDLGIRVDAIAGTSMGAVVGGLYASGMSAREIETAMTSVDWADAFRDRPQRTDLNLRRKGEDQNLLVKLPLGLRAGNFLLPKGLVQGQKLNQFLRRLTLPVANIRDFDALPTRFRALATDLETGAAVALKNGDLAQAMRASMSAPGLFAPVEADGRLLVDGGLSANLPVDVARALDVDVLIVVDAGFPLQARRDLQSVTNITNQMLAILIRHNSDAQRANLTANDVIIDPALGQASSYDFSSLPRLVALGEAAANQARARLAALASDPRSYALWVAARAACREALPRVDFVTVAPSARKYDDLLHANFDGFIGKTLDPAALADAVTELYGQGNLESLDYRLDRDSTGAGLVLEAQRNSWGPNYVRFGLSLQDDFAGNSTFNAEARFKLSELNRRGAEWIWDLQVGGSPHIATEWFQPLDYQSHWFVAPHARFQVNDVPLITDENLIANYRLHTNEIGVDFGRQFGNWGELRGGLQRDYGFSRIRIGDPTRPQTSFDVREVFVRFSIDRLDDFNFPRHGESLKIEWNGDRTELGSSAGANLVKVDWLLARSMGRNTGVMWFSAGSNLDENPQIRNLFQLGGFLNLSALAPNSLTGRQYAIARGLYFRQIGRGGEGFLKVPTYLGASFELGNVWDNRRDISVGSARRNGSVFVGLDTLLGPVYLGTGFNSQGNTAFYLFLGRTF